MFLSGLQNLAAFLRKMVEEFVNWIFYVRESRRLVQCAYVAKSSSIISNFEGGEDVSLWG